MQKKEYIMSKKIKVANSPLTNVIYAGSMIKNDTMWGANKQDVTMDCLIAVVEHCLKLGETIEICRKDGTPEFEITVKRVAS